MSRGTSPHPPTPSPLRGARGSQTTCWIATESLGDFRYESASTIARNLPVASVAAARTSSWLAGAGSSGIARLVTTAMPNTSGGSLWPASVAAAINSPVVLIPTTSPPSRRSIRHSARVS